MMDARVGAAARPPSRGRGRLLWIVAAVVVTAVGAAAVGATVVGDRLAGGPDRRRAAADAEGIARAVAVWVERHGELPRVTVTLDGDPDGWPVWGDAFVVGDIEVPRSEPQARVFSLAGTARRWCVEAAYHHARPWEWDAGQRWVSVTGREAEAGRTGGGRCPAELGLRLSPPADVDAPPDGSVVAVADLPVGACVVHPVDSAAGDASLTGRVQVRDCAGPHKGEVYAVGVLPDVPVDEAGRWRRMGEECRAAFRAYVGVPENVSAFAYEGNTPPPAGTARAGRHPHRSWPCRRRSR